MSDYPSCQRCHRPLKNPKWREIGMGKICWSKSGGRPGEIVTEKESEFSDRRLPDAPGINEAVVIQRHEDGTVLTNVPHLITHHSPTGFEFGYGGSGVADLAMNIIQVALKLMKWNGEKCRDTWKKDEIFRRTQGLYQDFKWQFLANMDRVKGGRIEMSEIRAWIEAQPYTESSQDELI